MLKSNVSRSTFMLVFALCIYVLVGQYWYFFDLCNLYMELFVVFQDLLGEASSPHAREDQGNSCIKVICRICFSGENEGSAKAQKMLSCKTCDKKYHRSCLKSWAEHRGVCLLTLSFCYSVVFDVQYLKSLLFTDLFHWSSWTCPSCRICEVNFLAA